MADSRGTFIKRVISAVLAVLFLLAINYFGGRPGLYAICTVAIVLGIREYSRMAFRRWEMPIQVTQLYWMSSLLFYFLMVQDHHAGLLWFAFSNVFYFIGSLWLTRNHVSNENLLPALALGTFGMLYCVLFPYYAVHMITLEHGPRWFLFLLLVVFSGDTFAYFGGRFAGRHKLMPYISPNKTWEGTLSGLAGSALVGTVFVRVAMPGIPWYETLPFCLGCGFAAQSGDLLMSLVKRVAQVKDTGHIMPGHGGILDRLDGIFIACPLVYGFALFVSEQITRI